jgi:hypothetical protein
LPREALLEEFASEELGVPPKTELSKKANSRTVPVALLEFTPSHTRLPKETLPASPAAFVAPLVTKTVVVKVLVDVGVAVVVVVVVVEAVDDRAVDVEEPRNLRPACDAWASDATGVMRKHTSNTMQPMTG